MSKGDVIILDVREPNEIEELGGYEGAINIPITELEKRLGELPKDKTILTA
jgi:rhodanese-related sulfurtransferase